MNTITAAEAGYRIDHPTLKTVISDMRVPAKDPGPGDAIPDFEMHTTDGGHIDNQSLRHDGRPALFVFGSITCPVTESAAGGVRDLHSRYGDRIRFIFVNVREAHPGEAVRQPQTFDAKLANAAALKAHHALPFEVAADDIDGTLHRALGPRPSSAYLIDPDGKILFRAQWSNVTDPIDEAIAAVLAGGEPPRAAVSHTIRAMTAMIGHADKSFTVAGKGAALDTFKAAPPFALMILMSRIFGFREPSRRGVPVMGTMLAVMAAVVIAAIALL